MCDVFICGRCMKKKLQLLEDCDQTKFLQTVSNRAVQHRTVHVPQCGTQDVKS